MEPRPADVTAVILAGGRSTRFGGDKALATWRGRPLVDHVLDRLPSERAGAVLVVRKEQAQDHRVRGRLTLVHDDPALHEGPLRGVIRGLAACRTPWAWVVACDQPLVSPALLLALRRTAAAADLAVIPAWGGRLHPLTGLYAVQCGPLLQECSAGGETSLVGALKKIGFRVFEEDDCRLWDRRGAGFLNINRPGQLALLEGDEP